MRVDHRRTDIKVTRQILCGPDVLNVVGWAHCLIPRTCRCDPSRAWDTFNYYYHQDDAKSTKFRVWNIRNLRVLRASFENLRAALICATKRISVPSYRRSPVSIPPPTPGCRPAPAWRVKGRSLGSGFEHIHDLSTSVSSWTLRGENLLPRILQSDKK